MKSVDTDGKILKSEEVKSGLISLINRKKTTFQGGLSKIIKSEFDLIHEAKKNGASWAEIVESLGFPEKENGFTVAYSREKHRRAKKEKEVTPEKKWTPAPKAKEEKRGSPGLEKPVPAGGARLIEEQKPEDLFNSMPKM